MRLRNTFVCSLALGLMVAVAVAFAVGCNGPSGPVDPFGEDHEYRFGGVLIKNYDSNSAAVAARLERNDTVVTTASISLGNTPLASTGDIYFYSVSPVESIPVGVLGIYVFDSSRYNDTLALAIPGQVAIQSVAPSVKAPSDPVTVTWSGASGAEGYIIAATKQGSAYLGQGYSQWVTSQTTSTGINDSAFMKPTGSEADPGMYDIFVYAYWGSPDSALISHLLPTPIPSQLGDNIAEESMAGTISTVIVSASRVVEVVAE